MCVVQNNNYLFLKKILYFFTCNTVQCNTINRVVTPVSVGAYFFVTGSHMWRVLFCFLFTFFKHNKNVLFIGGTINLNYLPITNGVIFGRSYRRFFKYFKYFNIGAVVFVDINKSLYLHSALRKRGVACFALGSEIGGVDFSIPKVYENYLNILYFFILQQKKILL